MAQDTADSLIARSALTGIASYLFVIAAFTSCDRPKLPGEPDKVIRNGRITFVSLPAADPRAEAVESGARAYLRNYPTVTLTVLHPYDDSHQALIDTTRNAVASQPHAVCLWIGNPEGADKAVEIVSQAGIPPITIGTLTESQAIFGHVQCSPVDAAELLGKKLDEWAAPQRSYVLLHQNGRTQIATEMFQRFNREASRHTRLIMLKDTTGRNDAVESADGLRDLLRLFPNAGVAVSLDPRIFWTDRGREMLGPENRAATLGASRPIWPLIAEGKAAAAGWIDADIGRAAMEFAVQSLADHRKTNRITVIEPQWVTKESLADFSKRYDAAKTGGATSQPVKP